MAPKHTVIHLILHPVLPPADRVDHRSRTGAARQLLARALATCREQDEARITVSDPCVLKPFLASYGEGRDLLRAFALAGRVETVATAGAGCGWLQAEGLMRGLAHERLFYTALLEVAPNAHLTIDACAAGVQWPQIAAGAGLGLVLVMADAQPRPACLALGPNGARVLVKPAGRVADDLFAADQADRDALAVAEVLASLAAVSREGESPGVGHDLLILEGDSTAAAQWFARNAQALSEATPTAFISTPSRYLRAVRPETDAVGVAPLCTADGPPALRIGDGWYSDLTLAARETENRILDAEKWATVAALAGARYPDAALDKAWRLLLATARAPHGKAALDALADWRQALELAAGVEAEALGCLAARTATSEARGAKRAARALLVFNPLAWERTDICRARVRLAGPLESGFRLLDAQGKTVPAQLISRSRAREDAEMAADEEPWAEIAFLARRVPSLGYLTCFLEPAAALPPTATPTPEAAIENEHFALRADGQAGGCLTRLYDKQARRELLGPAQRGANECLLLASDGAAALRTSGRPAQVQAWHGPVLHQLRVSVELPCEHGHCRVTQQIVLPRRLRRIEVRTCIEADRPAAAAVVFPSGIAEGIPIVEDRLAAVVARRSKELDQVLAENGAGAADLAGLVAQHWAEIGPGPCLMVAPGTKEAAAVPLGPCAVIAPAGPEGREATEVVARALLSQGVQVIPVTDSDDPDRKAASSACRVSLGRANAYSQRLLSERPEAARELERNLRGRGWAGVLVSSAARGGEDSVPVLVADTAEAGGLRRLADLLATAIPQERLSLPRAADFSGLARPRPNRGLALLLRGASTVGFTAAGEVAVLSGPRLADGPRVIEHALLPHAGDWRRAGVVRAGYEFSHPLRAVEAPLQPGMLPAESGLLSVDEPNLIVTAVKPLGNPAAEYTTEKRSIPDEAILVRLYEAEGRPAAGQLSFTLQPQETWLTDLAERRIGDALVVASRWRRPGGVELRVPACGLRSLAVKLGALPGATERPAAAELGPTVEPNQPVFCRHWDHNQRAAPLGNQPVALWMRGPILPGRNTRFELGISNDCRDREIAGRVRVLAPEGWTLIPREVPYRIPPRGQALYEVMVQVPLGASGWFLRAEMEDRGQVLQEVLPVGEIAPLQASLHREPAGVVVRLLNPNHDYIEGEIALIAPVEFWGEAMGSMALGEVSPSVRGFRLAAGEQQELRFALSLPWDGPGLEPAWVAAKIMWYGYVQYLLEVE